MRERIIAVFAVVVLVVVVLSFVIMRASLGDLGNKNEAPRAATAAVALLQVDALRTERWLAHQAATSRELATLFEVPDGQARGEGATKVADSLHEVARIALPVAPERVVLVDIKGVVVGRNGSKLLRGEALGERHPEMLETLKAGATASDVWLDSTRGEQLLVSYAPFRGRDGEVIGGLIIGTQFNDERLGATSQGTSGSSLVAVVVSADHADLVAKALVGKAAEDNPKALLDGLVSPAALDASRQAMTSGQVVDVSGVPSALVASARRLTGYGDDKRAVIVAVASARIGGDVGAMLLPLLGVIALGLLLVAVAGFLLDAYISRPVGDLEEGLLAIINGQTEIRFELEHAVLGGLVFRLNSLLNQLLGVTEDTTDDEGRPSYAPRPADFNAALNVDERMAAADVGDVADAAKLRDEDRDAYYKRIYAEYITAKRSFGDPVDHITESAFTARIAESERQLSQKHARPFRYRIDVQDKEVVLIAVPLG
ncbi:MAG: hypothetical protein IT373_23905 [Polyangiaceae bacterium]|nr:hypothetical protein [Polyangiaceae bacterium]